MDQQTNNLAALVLTTRKEQSTAPKSVQPPRIAAQQVGDDSDDVIYTNHFPCSFARDLTFYQYDVIVEEYHEKQKKYIYISSREKRRQFVCDLLLAKTIHSTAICWYDEGSCIYSTTNFKDKLPIIHEKEEQGYQRRLTIKSLPATSSTGDLDQSSIRIIETLIKQVLKEQFKAIGSVFYPWDEEPAQDGPYDLLTGFKQAMCLTESGPTLNVDITITRFYPHFDLLTFIWERLLQNKSSFPGLLSDRQYNQIGNGLKDVEVTTAQSDHQNRYVLTGYFSDHLPEKTFIEGQGNLLDYYKHLGFALRYPQLYCLKAYRLGNSQNLVDLPIELCSLREWQQVKEDESTKPIPAPPVSKRYHLILAAIRNCLITQCANFTKVQRMQNLRNYCGNLLKSVNAKLSGENKQVAQLQTSIKTMFIGADVQHTKNNYSGELPSIAAVVASMNSECTLTNQRVSRQWPSKGKQSEEAILLLKEMVEELLIAFKDSNEGALPEHVVFYRDGVDDGQFERVQNDEVTALTKAFQAIYPTNSSSPLLTFIVVKKRHHTRLFRLVTSTDIANVESGVVIDSSIVNSNPNYLNFFLNSHEPGLGTNKIGNYVVLVNEIEYSLSELEELTYSLCHTDQRIDSRLSESIPSVLHLADAAASKARQLFNSSTRPPNATRADVLRVHEDMQNTPNMF
ncbi:unnamed protein product [Rotaria sp. Silwood2]|nr:unnamed protein product [Rotaria sp. Silwood2]